MYKDKYYKKLEREYMSATGMVPTTSQLSEFFYEKKQMGKEYSLFLESLGLKEQSQIIEIGKGNVDSLAHSDTMKNISFTEISPYVYSFDKDFHIDKIYGNLELNKERIVIINSLTFPKTDIGNISSIIVEGDLNYSHLPIYSNLYSCSNALYFGIFGKKEDKNFQENIRTLNRMKTLLEKRSGKELEIYSNDSNKTYQKVIYYKKNS